MRVKSRNFSPHGIEMIAEQRTKEEARLMKDIAQHPAVEHASLVAHHGEKEL